MLSENCLACVRRCAVMAAIVLFACSKDGGPARPAASTAAISVSFEPASPAAAPSGDARLPFKISYVMRIRELNDVAATLNFWTETLENPATGGLAPGLTHGAEELSRSGLSATLPAQGTLAIPREKTYSSGTAGSSAIRVNVLVQVTDARNNVINTAASLVVQ